MSLFIRCCFDRFRGILHELLENQLVVERERFFFSPHLKKEQKKKRHYIELALSREQLWNVELSLKYVLPFCHVKIKLFFPFSSFDRLCSVRRRR